jgi:hypothetical protein
MNNVIEFAAKEKQEETQLEGAELHTLKRDVRVNIFFPGQTQEHTIVVTTTIGDVCNVIRSENHQKAVWEALCNLDSMRSNMYATAAGVAGTYGEHGIQVQVGLVDPE